MVITDARLGGMSGYELLAKIHHRWPELPALMITAYATPKLAVEAIKAGARLPRPSPSPRRNCFWPWAVVRSGIGCCPKMPLCAQRAVGEAIGLEQIVGDSPKMRECAAVDSNRGRD